MRRLLLAALLMLGIAPAHATVTCSLPITLVQGTPANAPDVMADFNALVSCLTLAASAGNNSDITALNGLTTAITPAQGGSQIFLGGTSTGSANAQFVTGTTPNTFTRTNGLIVTFTSGFTNTGATTLNVDGTGNAAVVRQGPAGIQSLIGGEIISGIKTVVVYDGAVFQLVTKPQEFGGFGVQGLLTAAATTDLGTVAGHFADITGAPATITSFGTSATNANPIYLINWGSAQTITTAGNITVLPGAVASFAANAGDFSLVRFDGANWQIFGHFRANGTAPTNPVPLCGASTLSLKNNAGTPNTQIDYSASQATLINPATNAVQYGINITGTNNTGTGNVTSTADGMDGETPPAPGFGFVWLIGNGTAINSLVSTSSTAPTMPSGFLFRCRVGAMRFDAGSLLFRTKQLGQHVQYVVTAGSANTTTLPNGANGIAGTYSTTAPVWVAVSLSSHVPTTAAKANLIVLNNWKAAGIANVQVAPNNSYGGYASAAGNPPPWDFVPAAANFLSGSISILLETQQFFWASSAAGGAVSVTGWEDSANVN